MRRQSPFEFDISVSADKRRRTRSRGMSGAVETSARRCDKPGCGKPGKFRAPKSRDHLDDYWWFCLDHVREYNQRWNFFEGSTDADLERQFAADRVWERPTRPLRETLGSPHAEGRAWARFGLDDPMDLLGDKATLNPAAARARRAGSSGGCRRPNGGRSRSSTPARCDQGRDPQAVQGAGQGPSPRHERRPPRRRGAPRRGGLGLGADQGEPGGARLSARLARPARPGSLRAVALHRRAICDT
jgi:hypothetical protein